MLRTLCSVARVRSPWCWRLCTSCTTAVRRAATSHGHVTHILLLRVVCGHPVSGSCRRCPWSQPLLARSHLWVVMNASFRLQAPRSHRLQIV